MHFLRNLTTLYSLISLSAVDIEFIKIFKDICRTTAKEYEIRTFIYVSSNQSSYDSSTMNAHLNVPVILHTFSPKNPIAVLNTDAVTSTWLYRNHFNKYLLSILQLSQNSTSNERLLKALWQRLHRNIFSSLVLLFDDKVSDNYVLRFLKFCMKHNAIHVIALRPQMAVRERSYWTLRMFPKERYIKLTFPPSYRNIFSRQLVNMYGQPLRLMAANCYPDFYNYTYENEPVKLRGFIGRALGAYAYRHNATIKFSTASKNITNVRMEALKAVENNTIDIGLYGPLELNKTKQFPSIVMNYGDWCLMVPVETPLLPYDFYWSIIPETVAILFLISLVLISCIWAFTLRYKNKRQLPIDQYFFNVSVLQGLLGMPFWTNRGQSGIQKFLTITISLAGIILGTAYSTYLQSFSVHAPIEQTKRTIDDFLRSGIKVAVDSNDVYAIKHYTNFSKYINNFTLFTNMTELDSLRNELDTRYAYLVNDMWIIHDMQQKYFSKPLFRLSDICLRRDVPLALPLPKNSVYHRSLNHFILHLQQAGLMNYWRHHTFIELTKMKKIKLFDRNKNYNFEPLNLADVRPVFILMGALWSLSILCFLLEISWLKIQKVFDSIKKLMQKRNRI